MVSASGYTVARRCAVRILARTPGHANPAVKRIVTTISLWNAADKSDETPVMRGMPAWRTCCIPARSVMVTVRRFTREEHERGETAGWRFEAGQFRYMSGLEWAWFSREITEWKP